MEVRSESRNAGISFHVDHPTDTLDTRRAEAACFEHISRPWSHTFVDVDGGYINTLAFGENAVRLLEQYERSEIDCSENQPPTLVLTHGYAAGVGVFMNTIKPLLEAGFRVFAIDWLGMGRSSRTPPFPSEDIDLAEAYFVDSLEQWRASLHLHGVVLLGHSLGAYISARYALKYPTHISKLLLASPAAVSEPPHNLAERYKSQPWLFRTILNNWDRYTPASIVRGLSWVGLGMPLARMFARRRFAGNSASDVEKLGEYLGKISSLPAGSETAMHVFFLPGAWARRPLGPVLQNLKVPVDFMFGEWDWMDPSGPLNAIRNSTPGTHLSQAKILILPHSGHNMMLDNSIGFCQLILKCIS